MSERSKLQLRLNRQEIFVAVCLAGSLASAISVPIVKSVCEQCADAAALAPVPGLNIIGAVFYGALLFAMIRFGLTSKIAATILFAAGIHLSLSVVLAINHIICIPCLLSLFLTISAGVASIPKLSARLIGVWTITGILVASAAFANQSYWTRMEQNEITRKAVGFSKWPRESSGPIVITVFYSDNCKKCAVYRQETLKLAQQKYGKDITIKLRLNPSRMLVPTTVVGGDEPALLIGDSSWTTLAGSIETSIARRHQRTRSATKSGVIF